MYRVSACSFHKDFQSKLYIEIEISGRINIRNTTSMFFYKSYQHKKITYFSKIHCTAHEYTFASLSYHLLDKIKLLSHQKTE